MDDKSFSPAASPAPASAQSASSADDDRWLTYLNYDQSIQQAVRRLGALSSANVDEFRSLLLKGRDRSRVKDYEAESIRRLQGEAFVGDEDLQRALIVLTAEDPRLGEEFKRVVAASGKPAELDQTIAAIRLQKDAPHRPPQAPENRASVNTQPAAIPLREPQARSEPPAAPHAQPAQPVSAARRLAIPGALAAVAVVGLIWAMPRLATQPALKTSAAQSAAVPLRPSAAEEAPAALPPPPVQAPPAEQKHARLPLQASARAPAVPEADKTPSQTPASVPPAPDTPPTATPVPGGFYKVVRGDMLSQIAKAAYRDAAKYPRIQQANPGLRDGPDRILVDQVIFIPPAP